MDNINNQQRPTLTDAYLSKRQRIMMWLEDSFLAKRVGVDGYGFTWTAVARRPLSQQEQQSGNAIAMYDLTESKTQQMQFQFCTLTIFAEFYHQMAVGEHPADVLNMMLTDVQRTFREDVTFGGLTIDCLERKNQIDVEGPLEHTVTGVVEFVVTYRHAADDPRR